MDSVKDGQRVPLGKYGCFNRAGLAATVTVQDGWTPDGRRRMVTLPFTNSRDCKGNGNDPRCKGCKHKPELK